MTTATVNNGNKKGMRLTKSKQRALDDFRNALHRLPDNWMVCRDMRHAWNVLNDFHVVTNGDGSSDVRRELQCMRCETVRRESFENNLYGLSKTSTVYIYPEKYQIHGVPREVPLQGAVRQEQFRRAMEKVANASRR